MKKINLIFLLVFCFIYNTYAQNYYLLQINNSTYKDLNAPIFISGDTLHQGYNISDSLVFPLYGFNMDFNSKYLITTGAYIDKNGFLAVDESPNYKFTGIVDIAFGHYRKRDSSTSLSLQYEGKRGSGILKFQWKNLAIEGYDNSNYVNFQMWFHELDQSISFHYGPSHLIDDLNPVIGLMRAPNGSDTFSHSSILKGSALYPSSLTVLNMKHMPFYAVDGFPTDGNVYTFKRYNSAIHYVGNEEYLSANFYPNPVKDFIKLNSNFDASIQVYDLSGKLLLTMENTKEINVSSLHPGLYFLLIDNKKHYKFLKK